MAREGSTKELGGKRPGRHGSSLPGLPREQIPVSGPDPAADPVPLCSVGSPGSEAPALGRVRLRELCLKANAVSKVAARIAAGSNFK